ncbi:unnamed protein product [Somion occarium]|uniref:Uncharacterized protein n=1 Tax=Somion occarium TaxID=3059160 RepID=A0ABP1DLL9_9APHY
MFDSRCFWYDNDGNGYKRLDGVNGCDREFCKFIHPWQKAWANAPKSSRPTPWWLLTPEENRRLSGGEFRRKGRSRSPSPSYNRNRNARYSSRRSRSPVPRDNGWRLKRPLPDDSSRYSSRIAPSDDNRGRSKSSASIRSSRSSSRRATRTPERTYGPPRPPASFINRETPTDTRSTRSSLVPPTAPRRLRENEQTAKTTDPRTRPGFSKPDIAIDAASSTTAATSPPSSAVALTGNTPFDPSSETQSTSISVPAPPVPAAPSQDLPQSASTPLQPPPSESITPPGLVISETPQPSSNTAPPETAPVPPTPVIQDIESILATLRQNSVMSAIPAPVVAAPPEYTPPPIPPTPIEPVPPTIAQEPSSSMQMSSPTPSRASSMHPEGAPPESSEGKKLWEERVRLLSGVLTTHQSLSQLDHDRAIQTRISDSLSAIDSITDKGRFKAEVISMNFRRIGLAQQYDSAIEQLNESEAWRLLALEPRSRAGSPMKTDNQASEAIAEVKTAIAQVMDSVKELHELLQVVGAKKGTSIPPAPGHIVTTLAAGTTAQTEDAGMSVPEPSDNAQEEVEVPPAVAKIHDHLMEIEDGLKEVYSSLSQRQEEISDEIRAELENRFNELELVVQTEKEKRQEQSAKVAALSQDNSAKLESVQSELSKTGDEVGELAGEVADVIKQVNGLSDENEGLRRENYALLVENDRLRKVIDDMERRQVQELDKMRKETDAITAAVQALAKQPVVQQPAVTSTRELAESVKPLILEFVHDSLKPLISDARNSIEQLLQSDTKTLRDTLVQKIEHVMMTMNALSKWADSVRDQVDPGYLMRRLPASIQQ